MKLFRLASTAALCLTLAGALAAQGAPQGTPQTPPAPRADQAAAAQARDAAEITIVGCLAEDKSSPDDYTLTVVPAATGGDAARASNPSSAASAKPATYKITGLAADQLEAHVNHQVELKGRINAARPAQAGASNAAQEFKASSVKMISATCPPAK